MRCRVHHTGWPIGALLSGVVANLVLATFGEGSWRYCFLLALLVAIPLMIFWAKYSTADRINTLYQHIDSQGLTRPATQESSHVAKGEGMKTFLRTLRNRNISLTAGNTLLTQIVYMGINVVLPPYLYHVSRPVAGGVRRAEYYLHAYRYPGSGNLALAVG